MQDIAKNKLQALLASPTSVLRFMNYDECKQILQNDKARNEGMEKDERFEDVLRQVSLFDNNWAKAWSKAAHSWVRWDKSYATPVNYQTLQSEYTKLLFKHKNKHNALRALRDSVLQILAGNSKRPAAEVIISRVNTPFHEHNKLYTKQKDLLLELATDPDFFVKREQNIRDVLFQLAPGAPSLKEGTGMGFHEHEHPYHVACFFQPSTLQIMAGTWGYLNANASQLWAIVGMIPSRTFCEQIKQDTINASNNNPYALTPVFNWQGKLVFP